MSSLPSLWMRTCSSKRWIPTACAPPRQARIPRCRRCHPPYETGKVCGSSMCEVLAMITPNGNVILCIENPLYRQYMEAEFANAAVLVTSVARVDLIQAIAEHPGSVLLLQSDTAEYGLIELSSRL